MTKKTNDKQSNFQNQDFESPDAVHPSGRSYVQRNLWFFCNTGFYAQSLEISQWVVLRLTGKTCLAVIAFTDYSGVNLGPKDRAKTQSDCLLMRKQCSVCFSTPQKGKAEISRLWA